MNAAQRGTDSSDGRLLARFAPVLVFTAGEMFFPTAVDGYLHRCSLWAQPAQGRAQQVAAPGEIDAASVTAAAARAGTGSTYLRFVAEPMALPDYLRWRRSAERAEFRAVGRWSRVGLLSRLVDAGFDATLLVRGVVPGGTSAVAEQQYRAMLSETPRPVYYGRVVREAGFTVCQYFFFYAMNDYRSSFYGVNDHESDWEQVMVYVDDDNGGLAADQAELQWVACAAHDLSGDDMRRRVDDPELIFEGGTHPTVFCGAGSHASYTRPGEFLLSVAPAALEPVQRWWRRAAEVWHHSLGQGREIRAVAQSTPLSIPFVDYARGDGRRIGPADWEQRLIGEQDTWATDYRGLWGLDTRDPMGGERAPAGPKYERDGQVRRSWYDPVGWCGLDKALPEDELVDALTARCKDLADATAHEREQIDAARHALRAAELDRMSAVLAASGSALPDGVAERVGTQEADLAGHQHEHARLTEAAHAAEVALERVRAGEHGEPRAHIRHEVVPLPAKKQAPLGTEVWAAASGALLLLVEVVLLWIGLPYLALGMIGAVLVFLAVDAAVRGTGIRFLLSYTVALAVIASVLLVITHWKISLVVLIVALAFFTLRDNLRELRILRARHSHRHDDDARRSP